jgi:cell wall-associated NlpC family hydrolase
MAVASTKETGRFLTMAEGMRIVAAAKMWAGTPYGKKGGPYAGANPVKKKGADCSGSTWKIYQEAGFSYGDYTSAAGFKTIVGTDKHFVPGEHFFKQVSVPQTGDIGWWSGHMVIYDPSIAQDSTLRGLQQNPGTKSVWSASSEKSTRNYGPAWSHWYSEGKPPIWYRYYKATP